MQSNVSEIGRSRKITHKGIYLIMPNFSVVMMLRFYITNSMQLDVIQNVWSLIKASYFATYKNQISRISKNQPRIPCLILYFFNHEDIIRIK